MDLLNTKKVFDHNYFMDNNLEISTGVNILEKYKNNNEVINSSGVI